MPLLTENNFQTFTFYLEPSACLYLSYLSPPALPPPPSFIKTLLSIVWNWRVILTKIKAVFKLVFLIVFNTKVWKLYCYKYHDFYLFLTLSTFFIHHFHSYVNIPSIPSIPAPIPRISTLITSIPIISLIMFPDFSFLLLQIALCIRDLSEFSQIFKLRCHKNKKIANILYEFVWAPKNFAWIC